MNKELLFKIAGTILLGMSVFYACKKDEKFAENHSSCNLEQTVNVKSFSSADEAMVFFINEFDIDGYKLAKESFFMDFVNSANEMGPVYREIYEEELPNEKKMSNYMDLFNQTEEDCSQFFSQMEKSYPQFNKINLDLQDNLLCLAESFAEMSKTKKDQKLCETAFKITIKGILNDYKEKKITAEDALRKIGEAIDSYNQCMHCNG